LKYWKIVLWFCINSFILFYFAYLHITIDKDAAIPFFYLMLLLTFPSGFLAAFAAFVFAYLKYELHIPLELPLFVTDIVIPWVLFMVFGTLQWFVWVPYMKAWRKNQ